METKERLREMGVCERLSSKSLALRIKERARAKESGWPLEAGKAGKCVLR